MKAYLICAAACWAGVIDNEVHVSSLSLQANGGRSKGSAKDCDVARMHGRLAMASQLNRPEYCNFAVRICRDPLVKYPQLFTASNSVELRSFYAWIAPAVGNCFIENLANQAVITSRLGLFFRAHGDRPRELPARWRTIPWKTE
jgi:hypothetical protein